MNDAGRLEMDAYRFLTVGKRHGALAPDATTARLRFLCVARAR
jgi:hypothetical protein